MNIQLFNTRLNELCDLYENWESGTITFGHVEDFISDEKRRYGERDVGTEKIMKRFLRLGFANILDVDGIHRTIINQEGGNLNQVSFAINHFDTRVRDDCIQFDANRNEITVSVTDVFRYLPPNTDAERVLDEAVRRGNSIYGISGIQNMFPEGSSVNLFSQSGHNWNGECISVTFRIETPTDRNRRTRLIPLDVRLTRMDHPVILSYNELENILADVNGTVCEEECHNVVCCSCRSVHLRRLQELLTSYRTMRFAAGGQQYFYTENDNCIVRVHRILRSRTPSISLFVQLSAEENAKNFVQEAMVASSECLSRIFEIEGLPIVRKTRRLNTNNRIRGRYAPRHTFQPVRDRVHGVSGYVGWTSPLRNAVHLFNHYIIHLFIRFRQQIMDGNLSNFFEDLDGFQEYVSGGLDILQLCDTIVIYNNMRGRLDRDRKKCGIYYWLQRVVQDRGFRSFRGPKLFVVQISNLVVRGGQGDRRIDFEEEFTGQIYFEDYGFTLEDVQVTNSEDLPLETAYQIIQDFRCSISINEVFPEDFYSRITIEEIYEQGEN